MKKVVITGITGQDGVFLTNTISKNNKDCVIHGTTRDINGSEAFFKKLKSLGTNDFSKIQIEKVNLLNKKDVKEYLEYTNPGYIYNLTGPSSVYKSLKKPEKISQEITGIFDNLIISLIDAKNFPNFFQASSSEMFGDNGEGYQDEYGEFVPNSPYAVSKLKVHNKIQNLREEYEWKFISGIMFNHESELRGDEYLIMKIIKYAKNLSPNKEKLTLGSLDYVRDWSFAGDITESMFLLNESNLNEDFVIGSGVGKKISNILDIIFGEINKDWKEFLEIDKSLLREGDPEVLVSKPTKLMDSTNWKPALDFESLILRCFNLSN